MAVSEQEYIQAGNEWQPDDECRSSQQQHHPDLWVLEFRQDAQQFRAAERATLDQVRQAFQSYLARGLEWRSVFAWAELEVGT